MLTHNSQVDKTTCVNSSPTFWEKNVLKDPSYVSYIFRHFLIWWIVLLYFTYLKMLRYNQINHTTPNTSYTKVGLLHCSLMA
jgi:hypothetical protein